MEVKEMIRIIENIYDDILSYGMSKRNYEEYEEEREAMIGLLKSLEASNRVYKEWNKELSIENEELNRLATIKYGKQLEAENKKLKKENEARKKMWNIVYEDYGMAVTEDRLLYKEMEQIEKKYLKE
jgi:cell shape-determining protein MreC